MYGELSEVSTSDRLDSPLLADHYRLTPIPGNSCATKLHHLLQDLNEFTPRLDSSRLLRANLKVIHPRYAELKQTPGLEAYLKS